MKTPTLKKGQSAGYRSAVQYVHDQLVKLSLAPHSGAGERRAAYIDLLASVYGRESEEIEQALSRCQIQNTRQARQSRQ